MLQRTGQNPEKKKSNFLIIFAMKKWERKNGTPNNLTKLLNFPMDHKIKLNKFKQNGNFK